MTTKMNMIATQYSLYPEGADSLLSEAGYTFTIDDEGAGAFIRVEDGEGCISINPEEVPQIIEALLTLTQTIAKMERVEIED